MKGVSNLCISSIPIHATILDCYLSSVWQGVVLVDYTPSSVWYGEGVVLVDPGGRHHLSAVYGMRGFTGRSRVQTPTQRPTTFGLHDHVYKIRLPTKIFYLIWIIMGPWLSTCLDPHCSQISDQCCLNIPRLYIYSLLLKYG